jgi:predicted acylesterase/phospholipase RssA
MPAPLLIGIAIGRGSGQEQLIFVSDTGLEEGGVEPAKRTKECDLVMKGGITSGVVYPSAVKELAAAYQFRNIGGASAGAIAAALAAAAEYGSRGDRGGFEVLDVVNEQLKQPGFLLGLFQPAPGARALFDVATALMDKTSSRVRRVSVAALRILARTPLLTVAALAGTTLFLVVELSAARGWLPRGLSILAAVIILVTLLVAQVATVVWRFYHAVQDNNFGICSGLHQPKGAGPAFTEWLHTQLQAAAGLDLDDPLTFHHLEHPKAGEPVNLQLVTTDLSFSRPVALPLEEEGYLFKCEDMKQLFPEAVVRAMWEKAGTPNPSLSAEGFRFVPLKDLPVLVAFRLSLSFPLLISAVPLYSYNERIGETLEHWFSDGGISSNFPIHFFDSLFPGRPTFGLDFQPDPGVGAPSGLHQERRAREGVHMPDTPTEVPLPRWSSVSSMMSFLRQILDTMENWRDTMQSELPGFRDRICEIYLERGEGGVNLNMPDTAIDHLMKKGQNAGQEILRVFNPDHWEQHRFTRYLTLMQMLQMRLQPAGDRFGDFAPVLEQGAPGLACYREGHDTVWCKAAAVASQELFDMARAWGVDGGVDFYQDRLCAEHPEQCRHCEPAPTATMRIVPSV